jgi:TonB family protein
MIRRSLAVIVLLAGAGVVAGQSVAAGAPPAPAAEAAATTPVPAAAPLAARVAVFRRPLPYVNGMPLLPNVPGVKLTPPESGWPASLEELRALLAARKRGSGVAVAELTTSGVVGAEGVQVFAEAGGGSVEIKRIGNSFEVKLPRSAKSMTLPAKPSTTVFGGKDEMVYLALTFLPPAEVDNATIVINNTRPPDIVKRVDAKLPPAAQADRVGGSVVLQARIERDGSVSSAAVVSAPREDVGAAASEAVKQWRFVPAKVNGQPVVAYLNVTMWMQLE